MKFIAPDRNWNLQNSTIMAIFQKTGAGVELMQRSLARGIAQSGGKVPPSMAQHLPSFVEGAVAGPDDPLEFPTNLRVLDAATGTLNCWRIEEELKLLNAEEMADTV